MVKNIFKGFLLIGTFSISMFLSSCGSSVQDRYLIYGASLDAARGVVSSLCSQGTISQERCDRLKDKYEIAKTIYNKMGVMIKESEVEGQTLNKVQYVALGITLYNAIDKIHIEQEIIEGSNRISN